MLEIDLSVSVKKVSGNGHYTPRDETRHYCQQCTQSRQFERGEFQPRIENLIYGAFAASNWSWGTPDPL